MIALDACFVLELFRRYHIDVTTKEKMADDEIFRKQWIVPTLRTDLIKMENQLPYFVLQQFYSLICTSSPSSDLNYLTEYAADFFAPLLPFAKFQRFSSTSHAHLLSFVHTLLEPKKQANTTIISIAEKNISLKNLKRIPGVSDLMSYDVDIRKLGGGNLLDMVFKGYVLRMHEIVINTGTIILFRNLLAHELCDAKLTSYIKSYISFLAQLVSSPNDIIILRKKGMMEHSLLNDEQLVTEIQSLANEVAFVDYDFKNCYLQTLIRQLRLFIGKQLYELRHDMFVTYFTDNTVFALLGTYIAIIQTIFAVIPLVIQEIRR